MLEFYKSFFLTAQQHNKISRQHGASTSDQFWYSKAAGRRFIWSWVSAFRSPSNLLLELSVGCGERKRLFWIRGTSSNWEKFWIRPEQWSIELLRYISFKISSLDRCSKLNMEMKRILFYATLKSCRVFKSDGIVKRYDLSRNKTLVKQDCHFNRQLFQILPSEGAFLQQKCWQLNWDE